MFRLLVIFDLPLEVEMVDALDAVQRQIANSSLIVSSETGADPQRNRLSIIADFATAADADTWLAGKEKRNIDYELCDPQETVICYYRGD